MAYTKVDQTPFAANLDASIGEFVVQLTDTQNYIAVSCASQIEPMSGFLAFKAKARVVNNDGTPSLDTLGKVIESTFSHTTNADEVASIGVAALQKDCLLAVLGEPTTNWNDPIHATEMEQASIRATLAVAPHVGYATAGTLL